MSITILRNYGPFLCEPQSYLHLHSSGSSVEHVNIPYVIIIAAEQRCSIFQDADTRGSENQEHAPRVRPPHWQVLVQEVAAVGLALGTKLKLYFHIVKVYFLLQGTYSQPPPPQNYLKHEGHYSTKVQEHFYETLVLIII